MSRSQFIGSSKGGFIASRASVCARREESVKRSCDTSIWDEFCLAGAVYLQLCPSLAHRPHIGCSLLHRIFLSLHLTQASRFPLPVSAIAAGGERRLGLFAFSDETGLILDPFLGCPVGGMISKSGLVHNGSAVLDREALSDMDEAFEKRVSHEGLR